MHYPGKRRSEHPNRDLVHYLNEDKDTPLPIYNAQPAPSQYQNASRPNDNKQPPVNYYDDDDDNSDTSGIYLVKQRYGYISVLLSLVQTVVLGLMIWQCKLAPLTINPMVGPYPDALSYWGGKNAYLVVEDGEYWRLITPIFLHAGIIHLFANVSVQIDVGAFFEREWGSLNFFIIYMISAVGSSLLSCVSLPNSISVGSSGALLGLFGGKLAEVFCRACESKCTAQGRIGHEVRMEQLGGVLCSVTIVGLFSFIPFVDWAAHLGGFVSGITVGLILFSMKIQSYCWSAIWFMLGLASTACGFFWMTIMLLNSTEPEADLKDVCGYYQQFYEDYECNCQYSFNNDNKN